ncbi:MAG: hypothetical protein Q8P76_02940 [bacterium]|nr:hypothetical protein [bacterium]
MRPKNLEIEEAPEGMRSEVHQEASSSVKLAMEAGKWKGKFETLKELFLYERKKRNEVEEDLRKLAYELGGVKNEVKMLEEKVRLLSSAPAKAEEQRVPATRFAPQPAVEINEPPKLFIQFADIQDLEVKAPEIQFASTAIPEVEFVPPVQPAMPQQRISLVPETPVTEDYDTEGINVLSSLETNFRMEADDTWGHVKVLLSTLNESPQQLYYEMVYNQETRDGLFYDVSNKLNNLEYNFTHYRDLVPVIDQELKNLAKVIPYVKHTCVQHHTETIG